MPKIIDLNSNYNKSLCEIYWKDRGFAYSIKRLKGILGVSDSFISHKVLKDIEYVVYNPKYLHALHIDTSSLVYVKKDDVKDWIAKNATFTRQTEIINLAYTLRRWPNVVKNAEKMYREYKKSYSNRGLRYGIMPLPILDYINSEITLYHADINYNNLRKEEGKIPWIEVEGFDILDNSCLYKIEGKNREKYYQQAFLNCDTKINFGKQVTLFCRNNDVPKGFELPYLVPLDPNKKVMIGE